MLEDRLHRIDDVVFSNFLMDDWLKEARVPNHVIIFVCSGVVHVEYGDTRLSVRKGQSVFLRRDHQVKLHKTSADGEPYSAVNVLLKDKSLRQYVREHKEETGRIREKKRVESAVILPYIPEVDNLRVALLPYFEDKALLPPEGFVDEIVLNAIGALVMMEERFCPTLFDFLETWKIDLPEFMEKNFTNDMTIREFALYTGRSLATFKRDFAKFSNLSPEKWLVVRRLETAYELLKEGKQSVSEVCWSVGFHSRSHFTIAFKRQYNILPSDIIARSTTFG